MNPSSQNNAKSSPSIASGTKPGYSREAYAAIITETQPYLLRSAGRLCAGDGDKVHDLVQEAYCRGYVAFREGRFQLGTSAKQWLTRIMTNIFINDYHKSRRVDVGLDDGLLDNKSAASFDRSPRPDEQPERALLSSMLDETIETALASLSPDLRAAVLLVDIEGMEYPDAAAALGTTQGTLRTRLSRARVRLHDLLVEYVRLRGRP